MPQLTELLTQADLPTEAVLDGRTIPVTAVTPDSRDVTPGTLFVAIPGTRIDGAAFIDEAVQKGAVAVITESHSLPPERGQREGARAVPVIETPNARLALSRLAAAFYPEQPTHSVGMTGTNGKTSTAEFYRQLWAADDRPAASLGTLGLCMAHVPQAVAQSLDYPQGLTSPDAVLLHRTLAALAQDGVPYVAIECSSHGLDQYRLDGVRFEAAAFTNLSHEHLDYHGTMARYFAAKARLFTELTSPEGTVVINADDAYGCRLIGHCQARGLTVYDYGAQARVIRLHAVQPHAHGLRLRLAVNGADHAISVPVYGAFQAHNIAAAVGLAMATGMPAERCVALLPALGGVHGRMERVGLHPGGAPVFIDYAHTPDALENVLRSLRAHTAGRVHLVFGCGGDRDRAKRPQMGRIAAQYADAVIITDDNPRHEDPAAIRRTIMAAVPQAQEIGDRRAAIVAGIQQLQANDVLIIAGKGHESYQIIGDTRYDFDDARIIKEALVTL